MVWKLNNFYYLSELVAYKARGSDLFDLLDRISTNTLKAFADGESRETILINEKARIVDILTIKKISDTEAIIVSADFDLATSWIDRFVFTEDVAFEKLINTHVLVSAKGRSEASEKLSAAAFDYSVVASSELSSFDTITKTEFDSYRIENLLGFLKKEYTDDFIPLEVGLLDVVSFTKGCYIGQEVIARLDTYKKVSKYLAHVKSSEELKPEDDYFIENADGKKLGRLTTVSSGKDHLAILHKSLTAEGSAFKIRSEKQDSDAILVQALTDKTYQ